MEEKYNGSLTGEPFLFYENKVVAQFLLDNLNYQEISSEVYSKNLFNYKTKKSIPKRVAAVYKRLKPLNNSLLNYIVNSSGSDAKMVVLYSLMESNRLFYEFMIEVIRVKYLQMDYRITKRDLNRFFQMKIEQSEKVAEFKEYTITKLQQVMIKILEESNIISDSKNPKLNHITLSNGLKSYFIKENKLLFLNSISITH